MRPCKINYLRYSSTSGMQLQDPQITKWNSKCQDRFLQPWGWHSFYCSYYFCERGKQRKSELYWTPDVPQQKMQSSWKILAFRENPSYGNIHLPSLTDWGSSARAFLRFSTRLYWMLPSSLEVHALIATLPEPHDQNKALAEKKL